MLSESGVWYCTIESFSCISRTSHGFWLKRGRSGRLWALGTLSGYTDIAFTYSRMAEFAIAIIVRRCLYIPCVIRHLGTQSSTQNSYEQISRPSKPPLPRSKFDPFDKHLNTRVSVSKVEPNV